MSILGQEAHDFLLKNGARRWDLLLGYANGEVSVSIVEVAFPENGKNKPVEWYKLGDVINGFDGYPNHHLKELFPVSNLVLYRPAFKDPSTALAITQHGQHHDQLDFIATFVPDKTSRAKMLRAEADEVEKSLERDMKSLEEGVRSTKATVNRTRADFLQRIEDLLR